MALVIPMSSVCAKSRFSPQNSIKTTARKRLDEEHSKSVQEFDVDVNSCLKIARIKNRKLNRQHELTVTHYQLSGWEDWGSSLSLDDVTDMVFTVSELTASVAGPVTVHCTEGTARTCTFIALHTLQRYVLQHALGEKVDVFTVLLNIIKCRPHMMQSKNQYMFIHDVVRVMVERKMRQEHGRRAVYQNTGFRDSSLYESTYAVAEDVNVYEVLGDAKRKMTSEL